MSLRKQLHMSPSLGPGLSGYTSCSLLPVRQSPLRKDQICARGELGEQRQVLLTAPSPSRVGTEAKTFCWAEAGPQGLD